jgi:hypothetical protein
MLKRLTSYKARARWQRVRVFLADDAFFSVAVGTCAVAAVAGSYDALVGLARLVGWGVWARPTLPASVDALAAAAGWYSARTTAGPKGSAPQRARNFASAVTGGAVAVSVAGNITFHLYESSPAPIPWGFKVAVGAVPALSAWAVLHLLGMRRAVAAAAAAETAQPQPPVRQPVPQPQPEAQPETPAQPRLRSVPPQPAAAPQSAQGQMPLPLLVGETTGGEKRAAAFNALNAEYVRTGNILSTDEVKAAANCGDRTAQMCIKAFRENVA